MRVILKKDVKGLGGAGSMVEVADGYGRNYLLARGLAILADDTATAKLARELQREEKQAERLAAGNQKLAAKLKGKTIAFALPASDKGQLFAGLKETEILLKIRQSEGELPPGAKLLGFEPLKAAGSYELTLSLAPGLDIPFKISINAK